MMGVGSSRKVEGEGRRRVKKKEDIDDSQIPALEEIYGNSNDGIFTNASYDDEGAVADFTNLESTMNVSPISTSRIHSIHPITQILGDPKSAAQTRSKLNKSSRAHAFISYIQKQRRNNHKDFQHYLKSCCNSRFRIGFWLICLLERRQLGQNRKEEGMDYDEVFAFVARIEAIRIFLVFASYMGFIVYHMDGFIDPKFPKKVYKVVKALYGLHQAPRAWYATLSTFLLKSRYRRGTINKTIFIKKDKNDIMLVQIPDEFYGRAHLLSWITSQTERRWYFHKQDKYVVEILKKFDFASVKTGSTPIETQKPLTKDEEATDMDVHLYRSLIGSLMYLTASRPDIMFVVCACFRFQYPRVSSFDLEAYSDSDYAGANLDRKSITGGCQFLGRRLISWQCKKQTIVVTFTTEAEYVAAANSCGQVLWIQNQMLDYGFNFMNTKIYIDNESIICIVKNQVFHSNTKHIEIRYYFIRDAYEKKLIQVLKIHTDDNVADLFTKAFDVSSKAVVVTEASIRSSLLLNDADGTACLTNEVIFQNLALMGYKGELNKLAFQKALFSPQWKYLVHTILHCLSSKSISCNEFSTNIASAVICLATNQKFNFAKLIFDGMLRNLDNPKRKFLMYPRFLMVFLNNQIELGEPFNDIYITPAHTLKVFLNMSRKRLKFLGRITPLFPNMLAYVEIEEGEGSEQPTKPQSTPSPTQPSVGDQPHVPESSSGPDNTHSPSMNLECTSGNKEDKFQLSNDSPYSGGNTSERAEGSLNLEELLSLYTNLSNRVLALETSKDAQAVEILKLKTKIKKLEKKSSRPDVSTATPMTPPTTTNVFEDEDIFLADALPLPKIDPKDKGKGVLEEEPEPVKVKSKDQGEAQIERDAEIALKVQAELDKEARLERQRQEQASLNYIANLYDEVQARIDADHELAVRWTQEEQEKYIVDERAKLLAEYFENRKKQLAEERAAAIKNKPPTRS
ncbi:putative ribonuclease H-like domain-containing protein [Tanacetum coccineum]|uniref:Ribonuclease H-like domain-containing protein n=1 Tax=Tanacetum coccineum TaxID=301880 RepID=A0ABQ4XGQ1_9ASTR